MHGVKADSFREGGGALRVCVCRVLAGVSDNEMQQGTKSWGPLFSVLQLHFHSRQSMILLNPLSCVHACMCVCVCAYVHVYVCMNQLLLCARVSPPPPPLLAFCMADPPNVITVSACLIYSRRE